MTPDVIVSGMGVVTPIGTGKSEFIAALLRGDHAFSVMKRPGRQQGSSSFLGAEIPEIRPPPGVAPQTLRGASLSTRASLAALQEAWDEARLSEVEPDRIGLMVGGSNIQQRELVQVQDGFRSRPQFLTPSYGLSFMDTDVCGFCTAQFGIRGFSSTVGGASASGQLAIVQAAQAVITGQVDVCIAIGALMDLSYWECQGLRAIGAMGSDRHADQPERACRPFDRGRDGFIFGESCGAVVIEAAGARRSGAGAYAALRGWGVALDANRSPDPSSEGEVRAIRAALQTARWQPSQIDYVNPHGTGSPVGDVTELHALKMSGVIDARINATKSLIGHGLSAAGTVEVIATLLQMRAGRLHPSRNLDDPIDAAFNWVRGEPVKSEVRTALTLSMGFGGMNTALCWQRLD
jgi:malonyl-ACP decarboxylase